MCNKKNCHFPIHPMTARKGSHRTGRKRGELALKMTVPPSQLEGRFFKFQVSNEKRAPGCLGYVGDYIYYPVI